MGDRNESHRHKGDIGLESYTRDEVRRTLETFRVGGVKGEE